GHGTVIPADSKNVAQSVNPEKGGMSRLRAIEMEEGRGWFRRKYQSNVRRV
ncbi:hypothetical protein EMCG_08802, partial [[Emmonsia] crescens]